MNAHCEALSTPIADTESLSGRLMRVVQRYFRLRKARRIDRDAFRHLLKLDDSLLQDIGVTRADVEWAARLPLSQDASDALQLLSRGHKKQ